MLRRAWRPVAATATLVGASGYIYHRFTSTRPQQTFEIQVRTTGPDGKRVSTPKTLAMLPLSEVEARLSQHATSQAVYRPGGIVWKHATAQLASNDPIEDAHAAAIVERDPVPGAPEGDYMFFSVMDGHAGPYTSRLLAKTLIPAVALQLKQLGDEPSSFVPKTSFLSNLTALFTSTPVKSVPFDADPKYISLAIQTAFAMTDSEIVNAPLRLIAKHLKEAKSKDTLDLSQHPMALATMLPALSGSCALLALLDTARRDLYVACTGDCRAVAGVWEEDAGGKGTWRVEVLSEDQTGRNPKELKRIQAEHPLDEASTVIQRGRILGSLEPSRAFGDSRYKWPLEIQQLLTRVFLDGNKHPVRRPPPGLKTPPYVTAQPVITHRKLSFLPLTSESPAAPPTSSQSPSASTSALRFIVLATDGLWDQLSSAEAVALVGGHLAGLKGAVRKSELAHLVPTRPSDDPTAQTIEGKDKAKGAADEGSWAFVDENVSQHLIRNAFGGADTGLLRRLLSIPAPLSRNHRDDVTVTVVWWEDGREDRKQETFKLQPGAAKAKL